MSEQYEYTIESVSRGESKIIKDSVRMPLFDCIRLLHFKDLGSTDISYRELIQKWVQTGKPTNTYLLDHKLNKELVIQTEIDNRIKHRITQENGATENA